MKTKNKYYCAGILRGNPTEMEVEAVSEKQAEYFFKKYYGKAGFAMRNVRAEFMYAVDECPRGVQQEFNLV